METDPTLKILILDDNAIDRETCRRYLGRKPGAKYRFIEHNSIEGAVQRVEEENPDCVLLDYHLHDGNGVEFLEALTSVGGPKRYPVVMLTGTGSEAIAVQVMKAGAQDYLVKDRLNPELLQRTVEGAVYRARTERLLDDQRTEMERLFREAQEANARKDQFLAALSHELRTPLTPVLAAVSTTDPLRTSPVELSELFNVIRRNVELEARLIDDMLDLTRISRGKLEVSPRVGDLHATLHHAAAACEDERAKKKIELEWKLDGEELPILADAARIQQVFWNLLKNALKFTPEGGRVTISTHRLPGQVEITVADTGIGLQPHTEEKIFEAFEQGSSDVTRRFGGLGLGLAISKALVESHSGTVRAANRGDGRGAIFTVTLPLNLPGEPAATGEADAPSVPPPATGATVLLVEDHADSAFFLKRMLDAVGYRVLLAGSVAEAFEVFGRENVEYMISDLGLPDGSGLELMEKVRSIRPIPAIALSGYGMEDDVRRSLAAGFSQHLTKPTDLQKLVATLHSLTGRNDAPSRR